MMTIAEKKLQSRHHPTMMVASQLVVKRAEVSKNFSTCNFYVPEFKNERLRYIVR